MKINVKKLIGLIAFIGMIITAFGTVAMFLVSLEAVETMMVVNIVCMLVSSFLAPELWWSDVN